jgi:uncharacterized damage-inducible protein DinB
MPIIDAILMEMDQEAKTTQRVLERIPEDKLSWRPHPRSFSLGQLAMHIAAGQNRVASIASKDVHEVNISDPPEAKSRKEILEALSQGTAGAKETLRKMDDSRLMSTCTLTKSGKTLLSLPRIAFIRSIMMNHIYHHRGQLSVYLRLLNVPVPSIYGPSADENPFA